MDILIRRFTRVLHQVDNVTELIESFPRIVQLALSDSSSLIAEDRRRILDFPQLDALENAEHEHVRRLMKPFHEQRQAANQAALAKVRPWVRQLCDEKKDVPLARWGYPAFVEPVYEDMEDYMCRRDDVLARANLDVFRGHSAKIGWRLQHI
ncbi:hypothetical protein F4810DRAFT_715321 [Camillea tinctor]|nr:hypothetical protein F4810DRAFT_715321 [Camillea tinctor]